ncbi:MAG: aquaporin [Deltaproteobacteria bacterium]|nr:aquaporin [Deltaproteobacteria bacterium]
MQTKNRLRTHAKPRSRPQASQAPYPHLFCGPRHLIERDRRDHSSLAGVYDGSGRPCHFYGLGLFVRFTGLFAGAPVVTYITFEAPISGMSMNPARTFGSAFSAQAWQALWIYLTAPVLGMLLAAQVYLGWKGKPGIYCAKLHHESDKRCIFCGRYRIFRLQSG